MRIQEEAKEEEEVRGQVLNNLNPLAALLPKTCLSRCHHKNGGVRLLYTLKRAARPVGMLRLTNSTKSSLREAQ